MEATRLCIAGKNQIAVDALRQLARTFEIVCLPNPSDTGEEDWQPSLLHTARDMEVPTVALEDLYGRADLCFLSLEYSEIIRPERFATDRLFNVHFSLLPYYRGCNTSVWPILNGEAEHGVTLHVIDAGVDTGPIIDQRAFALGGMTSFEAYMACQRLGLELALEWVPRLMRGEYQAVPQGTGTTYPRGMLDFTRKELDLGEAAQQVVRRIRAFTFPPYQRPTLDGRTVMEASLTPFAGGELFGAADGAVYLRFE